MDIRNRRGLRQISAEALQNATGQPKQVVLLYAGVTAALSLISVIVSVILENQIEGTGGLSAFRLRSVLSTIQSLLPFVQMLVTVCLELGYHGVVLNILRRRSAEPRALVWGFYRFGPLLRALLLQACVYFAVVMGSMYLSSFIFMMLPVSKDFMALMEPLLASVTALDASIAIDDATLMAATDAMLPMVWIFLAVSAVLLIPIAYRFRMVTFCLADSERPGALAALRDSRAMMQGNRFALFRLDLGFWWFYALQALTAVVCYGDLLLPMVGMTLPWSATVSYFVFFIASLVLQVAVFYFFMNRVYVTYAAAYETLRPKPQEPASQGVPLGNIFDM